MSEHLKAAIYARYSHELQSADSLATIEEEIFYPAVRATVDDGV